MPAPPPPRTPSQRDGLQPPRGVGPPRRACCAARAGKVGVDRASSDTLAWDLKDLDVEEAQERGGFFGAEDIKPAKIVRDRFMW